MIELYEISIPVLRRSYKAYCEYCGCNANVYNKYRKGGICYPCIIFLKKSSAVKTITQLLKNYLFVKLKK